MSWNNSGLTDDEALAFMEAVNKAMKPNLDDAKGAARQALLEQFERDGKTDRQGIFIDGEKVGDTSLRYTGGKITIKPGYEAEALEHLYELGLTQMVPAKGWEERFTRIGSEIADVETGEIVTWAEFTPKTAGTAVIKGFKPETVFAALMAMLGSGGVTSLLLGEGVL